MSGPGSPASIAKLRTDLEKLKKSVEALEAAIDSQPGQTVIGTPQRGITVKKNGDVVIHGNNIDVIASGRVNIKSSKQLTLKGKKIVEK